MVCRALSFPQSLIDTGLPAVKKHLGRIYEKLGVQNRTAATATVQRLLVK